MDILLLEAVVAELQQKLSGVRFAKIHQPASDTLILRLWNGRENLRLLITVGPHARLHLTDKSYPNPFTPPRFCQLLRARLVRLDVITLVENERIVCLECSGAQGRYKLFIELFGTQGNVLLIDEEGLVVDALFRRQEDRDGRVLLPGRPYRLPQPLLRSSLRDHRPVLPADCAEPKAFQQWLQREITPMSPAQAKALAWCVSQGESAETVLDDYQDALRRRAWKPTLWSAAGDELLVAYPPPQIATGSERNLSELLDDYFYPKQFEGGRIGHRSELQRILNQETKKLKKRLAHIAKEGEEKESFDGRRELGNLLLANLHQVKKGMVSVTVVDYTATPPAEVTITLDPKLSPQENAEALFHRYKKEKRGIGHIERRRAETREELDWLEQLQHNLDESETPEDLFEVAEELKQAGLYRERSSEPASRKKVPVAPTLNKTTSPSGFVVMWGRNNRSNDYLSTRASAAHDYWFHAHKSPGCHLVLKRDSVSVEVPEDDLRFAAALAAGYSRVRDESRVEVACCLVKDVYKVKGAHPGQVCLRQFTTMTVEPYRLDE